MPPSQREKSRKGSGWKAMLKPRWLRELLAEKRGNALVICAATLPLMIGSAAVGVDTIQVSVARRQLQRAADSAALAGAYAKAQSMTVDNAVAHDLTLNN